MTAQFETTINPLTINTEMGNASVSHMLTFARRPPLGLGCERKRRCAGTVESP